MLFQACFSLFRLYSDCYDLGYEIFAPENMNNMIIETIKRLSIDMFIAIMAIEAIVIAAIALSLLIGMFCK